MKIRLLYLLFFVIAGSVFFLNNAAGPAEVQGADRTNSPLSNGTSCSLSSCHNSGVYSPGITAQLLDGETAVSMYEPGKTYTLSIAITGADEAAGYGFQSVLLYGEGNLNAGDFGTPPAGVQVIPLDDRMYAEQSMRSSSSTFAIDWTAPSEGVGDIRLYAAGNAANGNGSNSGDQGVALQEPIVFTQAGASSANDRLFSFNEIRLAPNPTRNHVLLTIDNDRPGLYRMSLFDATGKNIQDRNIKLVQGIQSEWIDLTDQPNGLYLLQFSNG
ncbi:MAG: T9SS type A sorting domain-containing protein, partial [Lewinella sp.]|nr:T9SS type A sorting domain-containing protein [Lewinella sp.]